VAAWVKYKGLETTTSSDQCSRTWGSEVFPANGTVRPVWSSSKSNLVVMLRQTNTRQILEVIRNLVSNHPAARWSGATTTLSALYAA
jgi:hypothetical protein